MPPGVQRALPACLVCFMHHRRHILRRSDGSWSKKEKKKPVGAAPLTSVPIDVHAVVVCRRQNAQARSKTRGYCRGHETLQCRAGDPAGSPPHAPCNSNVTSPSAAAAAASTLVTGGNLSRPTALAWRPGLRSQVTTRANDVNSSLVASAPPRRAAGRQSDNFPLQTVVVTAATTTTTTGDVDGRRGEARPRRGRTRRDREAARARACVCMRCPLPSPARRSTDRQLPCRAHALPLCR